MNTWDDLEMELIKWSDQGVSATFWWRDDDAIDQTPALHRLYGYSRKYGVPLTLAVIPRDARLQLCTGSGVPGNLRLVQHGYAHVNHAPKSDKKSEFGLHRDLGMIINDVSSGLAILKKFPHFFPSFVPPWNRVDPDLYDDMLNSGIHGISTFGSRGNREPIPGLVQANTHVDIIDWHGTRGFAGVGLVCKQIIDHLVARRTKKCDFREPTGILTHHLVHDDECWRFLDVLFGKLGGHSAVRWLDGTEVFTA